MRWRSGISRAGTILTSRERRAFTDMCTRGARHQAGRAWLASSSWAFVADGEMKPDRAGIEARLSAADTFVHVQDLPETDLLLAADYAAHEAGGAAGGAPP